jgi:hypothetical protein
MKTIANYVAFCFLILLPLPLQAMQKNVESLNAFPLTQSYKGISQSEILSQQPLDHEAMQPRSHEPTDALKGFLQNFFPWLTFSTKATGYSKNGHRVIEAQAFAADDDENASVNLSVEVPSQGGFTILTMSFFHEPVLSMPAHLKNSQYVESDGLFPSSINQNTLLHSRTAFKINDFASYYLEDLTHIIMQNSNDEFSIYASDTQEKNLFEIHGDTGKLGDQFTLYISSCRLNGKEFELQLIVKNIVLKFFR